jgi:hypothetical protein
VHELQANRVQLGVQSAAQAAVAKKRLEAASSQRHSSHCLLQAVRSQAQAVV